MEVIEHYKKKLLRHIDDPDTVMYCLKKLDTVPVTMEILQDSEVGKVVNRLRKRSETLTPDVITSSKALVDKWKEVVKNTEEADKAQKPSKLTVAENPEAVTSLSTSKSKTPSDEKKSSSKNHHHHHKKEKKDKHKEKSHHHKHHKSHKSSSKEKTASLSSNGKNSSNGNGNIDIPDINPNYKPPKVRPRISDTAALVVPTKNGYQHAEKAKISDDDALTTMINLNKSGRNRTSVYSGRKTSAFSHDEKFPTLVQLCTHVLQDNVSRIDECGSVPYEMLKSILERGKPDDIMRIEDYNPRLMEDTGELWERIVKRHFPRGDREEFESYREMYERLVQERAEKLDKLMGKVQNKYASLKTNNKQTKLTYVDSVAKPPRGVKRAQEKNGTFLPVGSSLDKVKKARMTPRNEAPTAPSTASAAKKPKVAPMMARTLKMARGLKTGFKR